MSPSRIPPLAEPWPADVANELAAMMPPGVPPIALFRVLARSPRILGKVRASNLLDRGPLERRERELVILRTCARCGSEYEWGIHAAVFARRFGLSDAEVEGSLRAGWRDALWSERDRLLVRLVDELHEQATLSDELWQAMRPLWTDPQLIELIVLAGFYHTISFVTNALTIPPEDSAERFPVDPR